MEHEHISSLLSKYNSDKVSYHSYGSVYDTLLEPIKYSATNILEIGILEGNSMKAWKDFFPNATIHGIDNESHRLIQGDRFKSYLIDTKERDRFINIGKELPQFDFICDDASHVIMEQVFALCCLWNNLKSGGWYVIEDIYKVEYLPLFSAFSNAQLLDRRHLKGQADDMMAVIRKN